MLMENNTGGWPMAAMGHFLARLVVAAALLVAIQVRAESKNLAPGFQTLPKGSMVTIMQPDIELFSISAGGIPEPKADWTEAALKHVQKSIDGRMNGLGLTIRDLAENDVDELAEVNALHAAVARSIALHHMMAGNFALPTKNGKLDWSLGDAVAPLREKAGSDYALFVWMRDTYASAERKVAMFALALLGVGIPGGFQVGYASLVDLRTGQVLWFNQLVRGTGDLREEVPANETIAALLKDFPESQ